MNFTIENLEFYVFIIVRISAFIYSAPIFSLRNIPARVKAGISVFLGLLTANMLEYTPLVYNGVIGYGGAVIKELLVGLILGFIASACMYIVNFAGEIIDMEIGFSMSSIFDPSSGTQITVTGNFYSYMVMLMLLVTNMHYYIISAVIDSFKLVPVGEVMIRSDIYKIMAKFMFDYFVIGFRIVLPFFAASLLVNIILGVMTKVAPQMNMFAIGMQLKVIVGIFVLFLVVETVPMISDFIFTEMRSMMNEMMGAMMKT